MTAPRGLLPTLTEIIAVAPDEIAPTEPLPLAPETVALDNAPARPTQAGAEGMPRLAVLGAEEAARLVDAVVARLQPRLEDWVRDRIEQALQDGVETALREALRSHVDAAAADVARRLRSELPALARAAFDEVRPDGFES